MDPTQIDVVFFDLDGTLFDHGHSLRCAMSAAHTKYPALAGRTVEELMDKYSVTFQQAHDAYRNKTITYEKINIQNLHGESESNARKYHSFGPAA
jgi:FMN phosphatase YigB (HAD superfamily)